jgi:hypothetical protein
MTSWFSIRTQPLETAWPIVLGWLVPWMQNMVSRPPR